MNVHLGLSRRTFFFMSGAVLALSGCSVRLAPPDLAGVLSEVAHPRERPRIALDHKAKSLAGARQFTAAMDRPANPPPGLSIQLVAGDAMDTPAVVALNRNEARVEIISQGPGDGTVLYASALLDEQVGREERGRLIDPDRVGARHPAFQGPFGPDGRSNIRR